MRRLIGNRTLLHCLLILSPFLGFTTMAVSGILGKETSLSSLVSYRYLAFLLIFIAFVYLHSFYMFRRNIKWASISISAGLVYSLGVLLGFVATVETFTNINYGPELVSFVVCAILMNVFFSYLFFGLVAKDYYKKPKRTTVYELLSESSKKYLRLFLNILIPLLLIFFCTITLGLDFFLGFTSLMVAIIVVSVLSGVMFPVAFYLICLKRLG